MLGISPSAGLEPDEPEPELELEPEPEPEALAEPRLRKSASTSSSLTSSSLARAQPLPSQTYIQRLLHDHPSPLIQPDDYFTICSIPWRKGPLAVRTVVDALDQRRTLFGRGTGPANPR